MIEILEPRDGSDSTRFQLKKHGMINELLELAVNEQQEKDLYAWIQKYLQEYHVQYSISLEQIHHLKTDMASYQDHMIKRAVQEVATNGLVRNKAFMCEELSKLDVHAGYVRGEHQWAQYERRWLVSLMTLELDK